MQEAEVKANVSNTKPNCPMQNRTVQYKPKYRLFPPPPPSMFMMLGGLNWGQGRGEMKEEGMTSVASSYFQEVPLFKNNLADCVGGREEHGRLLAYCSFQAVFLGLAFRLGSGTNGQEMYGISTSCQMICCVCVCNNLTHKSHFAPSGSTGYRCRRVFHCYQSKPSFH